MKKSASLILVFITLLICATPTLATDAHAEEILKLAKAAVGGEEQLQKVQSLNLIGQFRRVFGERQWAEIAK